MFVYVLSLDCSGSVVSTSASDCLERLVSEMTCNVLIGEVPFLSVVIRVLDLQSICCGLDSPLPHFWVATLGKLLTHVPTTQHL